MNQNNLFELETLRTELIDKSFNSSSSINNLNLFVNYFETILSHNNPNIIEAFLKEFIADFITSIKKFDVWGVDPSFTNRLNVILEKLSDLDCFEADAQTLLKEIERIKNRYDKLLDILDDKEYKNGIEQKAYFPLIDKEPIENIYGVIDSITVRISKCAENNKFIIVPSEKEIEKRIIEQCENSWKVALIQLSTYIKKPFLYHEIIISFDKKIGIYEGNSLGIALTLTMLEELLRFYNPEYIIKIKERSAFTGGVSENGRVLETGEEIIKQKVKAIFFSEINTFVLPKYEETYAQFALTQFKLVYPNRNLKLISAEDISDVINRRDVVDIKKQKFVVRSAKFVKKNWISAVATVLLAILFGYLFVIDFDDNPAILTTDGTTLFVKNKNSRVLWTLNVNLNVDILVHPDLIKNYAKIIDLNNDNENELLFIQTALDEGNVKQDKGTIICYDKYQKIKWRYNFQDTVYSERENLQPLYSSYLIDTATVENKKVIFFYANNSTSFSSAIFALDINTGKRIDNTQWNSGYTWDAMIIDFEGDGEKELVATGADNGLKDAVIWGMKLKNVNGYRPTTQNYMIYNFDETDLQFYIRIPNTDYDSLSGSRSAGMLPGTLAYDIVGNNIRFTAVSTIYPNTGQTINTFHYILNYKRMDFDIYIVDEFSYKRDSLVTSRRLNPPYTDTKEYKEIIKNRILFWENGNWLKDNEFKKTKQEKL